MKILDLDLPYRTENCHQELKIPKSHNFYRAEILKRCEGDLRYRSLIREKCRRDVVFWIDTFCWTKDPRKRPDTIPWKSYESYQIDTIAAIKSAIRDQHDLLLDKSRDMGVSWKVLYVFLHEFLFEPGADIRIGSWKEEYVDRIGDMDSLFEKLRFALRLLPLWQLPKGFDWRTHSGFSKLANPGNGNSIVGESANENFASGGRRRAVLMDEFAKWDNRCADGAWTSTADVTNCRIVVSTPKGSANKFALISIGKEKVAHKRSLHWSLHPEKNRDSYYVNEPDGKKIPIDLENDLLRGFKLWSKGVKVRSPWYDSECERRKSLTDIAQELDIDYLKSGCPFFDIGQLNLQKVWSLHRRKSPADAIPWGFHIAVDLIESQGDVEIREREKGFLKLYEFPLSSMQYVVSGDTSEGLPKGDESFAVVRDKVYRNVVAVMNGLWSPEDFAYRMWMLGRYFNSAMLAPENNNHGYSVCKEVNDRGCKLYYTIREETKDGRKVKTGKRGWTTTSRTRFEMLDLAAKDISSNLCELRDETLIDQCRTFVNNDRGKPEADGIMLDDGVIAFSIGGIVIREYPFSSAASKKKRIPVKAIRKLNAGIQFGK